MTLKTALLATIGPMTPVERAMGRYMRAPDHDASNPGEGGGDDDDYNFDFEAETVENEVDNDDDDRLDEDSTPSEEDEEEESGSDEDEDDERDKRIPDRAQRRIDRLTRRAKEAEEELQRLRGKSDGDTPKPKADKKPVVTDFDNYEDFVEASVDWRAKQLFAEAEAKKATENADRDFQQRLAKGRKNFRDWDKVVTDDVKVSVAMKDAIMDSEDPAGILYYLGKNPDEADDLLDLSPTKQIKAIGRLEAKLANKGKDGDKPRRQSGAPEPIVPVKGSGKRLHKSVEDIDDVDDFIRARNKQEGVSRSY